MEMNMNMDLDMSLDPVVAWPWVAGTGLDLDLQDVINNNTMDWEMGLDMGLGMEEPPLGSMLPTYELNSNGYEEQNPNQYSTMVTDTAKVLTDADKSLDDFMNGLISDLDTENWNLADPVTGAQSEWPQPQPGKSQPEAQSVFPALDPAWSSFPQAEATPIPQAVLEVEVQDEKPEPKRKPREKKVTKGKKRGRGRGRADSAESPAPASEPKAKVSRGKEKVPITATHNPSKDELLKYATDEDGEVFDPTKEMDGDALEDLMLYPEVGEEEEEEDGNGEGEGDEKSIAPGSSSNDGDEDEDHGSSSSSSSPSQSPAAALAKTKAVREKKYRKEKRVIHNQLLFRIAYLKEENARMMAVLYGSGSSSGK